eukprot:TRINITY_DN19709_c0_g1_i1.p2 TRINITY_DN19709_c0_g1~~TRINITY_DN19709_c0_g1_i1.p2  ORF type:complete len:107 (+),score=4.64 TRINITY_DN19709_c0_g1_i1:194-514(+)
MWKSNVVTISMATCTWLLDLMLHRMYRFVLLLMQHSQDSVAALDCLKQSGLADKICALESLDINDAKTQPTPAAMRVSAIGQQWPSMSTQMAPRGCNGYHTPCWQT